MSQMDFNRLRTFLIVAETGNVTQAAKRLFRTQPAITQQMKLFQEELDLVLFERRKARIFLTAQGKALYDFAKPRIQELEDMPLRLRNDSQNLPGKIRLGTAPELGALVTPSLMVPFQASHPKIQFECTPMEQEALEEALLEAEIDFAITMTVANHHQIESHPLNLCSRLPVAAPAYLAEHPRLEGPSDLKEHNLVFLDNVLPDWQPWLDVHASDLLGDWPFLAPKAIVKDISNLIELVKRGMGIGMGFLPLINHPLTSGLIKPVFPQLPPMAFEVQLARRRIRNPHWAHDLFDEFARISS